MVTVTGCGRLVAMVALVLVESWQNTQKKGLNKTNTGRLTRAKGGNVITVENWINALEIELYSGTPSRSGK